MAKPTVQAYFSRIVAYLLLLLRLNPVLARRRAVSYRRWLERARPTGNIVYDAQRRLMLRMMKNIIVDAERIMKQRGISVQPPTSVPVVPIRPKKP